MSKIKWPTRAEHHAYMSEMQLLNRGGCMRSRAEAWMKTHLDTTDRKWTRQAQWGYRLFDFWCHEIGIAVEVDGREHDAKRDSERDDHNYRISGIVVIRVPNFDEPSARHAIRLIRAAITWNERRASLGLKPIRRLKP